MDVRLRDLAAEQHDVVAAWQLLDRGWSRNSIRYWAARHGWTVAHPGVYLLTHAPPTRLQLWMAATLSARDSVLSPASSAACRGFREHRAAYETITRPGSGGPRRIGSLLVSRSALLAGEITRFHGIPMTSPARTLIDLSATLSPAATARSLREAVRLEALTISTLVEALGTAVAAGPGFCGIWRTDTARFRTRARARTRRPARSRSSMTRTSSPTR